MGFLDNRQYPPQFVDDDTLNASRQHVYDLQAAWKQKRAAYQSALAKFQAAQIAENQRRQAAQAEVDKLAQAASALAFPVTAAESEWRSYQDFMTYVVEPHVRNQDSSVPTEPTP